jgi:hypothetical protein
MENQNNLIQFEGDKIRKIWHNEEWFSQSLILLPS